ncbi:Hypothetical predicted protein [Mytilus galloprovincialis]|uniref:Uncharacterized protein n=1 Tax=Mytilus galloprovincialis TaxID=29158 RepID=A0A8B6EH40_MYTGA|nr:Hypothetical predicted protein [Mytilus galloprovincialis]
MDRHRLRNILSIVLFSCELVLTKEVIYKSLESKVTLVCPVETTRDITWTGPPEHTIYAIGTDVSPHVSTLVEIKETVPDKKSALFIHRFTEDISGEFRCSDGINEREFNLVIKRDPSGIAIVGATGGKITTVEGREHNFECSVTRGQPGGNITWSTDGAVVAINKPSSVYYKLIPQRSDNGKLFKCEAFNSEGESILESSVRLSVFYIPNISFSPNQTITVKEGEEAELICINDGNDPDATTVWKIQRTKTIVSKNDKLNFKNVNRKDAGLYTCRIDTQSGVYEDNAKVVVQYAPTIDIRYFPRERKMKCIPSGIPDRYMFRDWEHTTEYNDHIRFLSITKEGNTATLNVTGTNNHRDRGIYICRASNNISSTDGMFVMQKYNLSLNDIPYFVSSTKKTQYEVYLKTVMIEIKFVSVPEYNSYNIYKNGSTFVDYTSAIQRNMKLTDKMYGKNVSVKGSILSLQIKLDTLEYFTSFQIVIKNALGSSNHAIKLVSASAPFMPKILQTIAKQTQIFVVWKPGFNGGFPQWFIVEYKAIGDIYWRNHTTRSSNSIVIDGLHPATKYLIRMFSRNMIADSYRTAEVAIQTGRLKHRYKERIVPGVNVQTHEGNFGESAHYTEIIEDDNPEPTSQEGSKRKAIVGIQRTTTSLVFQSCVDLLEKGETSASLYAKATSEKVVKLSRTKELLKDESCFRGQHNVNSKLISSCNETARTIKDDTTQEDRTKNLSSVKKSSKTNQDKRLLHNNTSVCESYETTTDERNENKIPSEEYRSVYEAHGIPEPVVHTTDKQNEKTISVICEPVNDVVILHPDRSEDVELANKILKHLMTIVPGLKGDLHNDVFLPGKRIFQVDHLFKSHYIFILITPFYSLPESSKLHYQVDMMLRDSLEHLEKKGRIIPVLVEKNIELPIEFASIKPLKFYLTYDGEQIDKSQYFSRIKKLFGTKLNRENSCTF